VVRRNPLCLSEANREVLSADALSSERDTIDAIPYLKQNIEGLVLLFSKLSVLVFEYDNIDGSREAFREWANEGKGYFIDLTECP
jgi:hypothetical protein